MSYLVGFPMSTINPIYFLVSIILSSFMHNYCFCCITTENWNYSSMGIGSTFSVAVATWYGEPNGAGSDGGACGYRSSVQKPPFSRMISAGNANLFQSGLGCGACYQVKCSENRACSGKPVTVTITDECNCDSQNVHFDLSGAAFGAMAKPGQADILRQAGKFYVHYRRVGCNYGAGSGVAFEVDSGSNPYYFACVIKYLKEDGDLSLVELKSRNSEWMRMQHSWGATWKIDLKNGTPPPFSIRLTTLQTKKRIVAQDVIPPNWRPGDSYQSFLNYS